MFFYEQKQYQKPYTFQAKEWDTKSPVPACESKNWKVTKMFLPKGKFLDLSQSSKVCFTAGVTFTVLHEKQSKTRTRTWMSDTPYELRSGAGAIGRAKGDVFIGGLGIGYTLLKMVEKKSVKSIIVLEHNQEVIDLVWPHLEPHCQGKVKLIKGDLYKYKTKKKFDFMWLDIWIASDGFEYQKKNLLLKFWNSIKKHNKKKPMIMFWGEYFHKYHKDLYSKIFDGGGKVTKCRYDF